MDKKTEARLRGLMSGIGLCLFVWLLSYLVLCIFFSELKNYKLSIYIITGLSALSAAVYILLEKTVFSKTGSSSFAIGYFGMTCILCAFVFFVTNIVPLNYIFDTNYIYTGAYLRRSCIILCLFNGLALVIKLGSETFKYIKNVFGS